jgi:gliding motility-associated-like protein
MKSIRKVVLLTGFFFGSSMGTKAQNVIDNKVYRVTAFQQGNNTITSTSNYAEVIPPLNIYIPSAFTPNGDGINDNFGVKGEGIRNYHLFIYNRWGTVIFESTNPKQQWDGKYNGEPAESGTYVYQLFATGVSSKGKTGSVTLVY